MTTLEEKRLAAIEYLESRGKRIIASGNKFTPTKSVDRFSILKRYGKKEQIGPKKKNVQKFTLLKAPNVNE